MIVYSPNSSGSNSARVSFLSEAFSRRLASNALGFRCPPANCCKYASVVPAISAIRSLSGFGVVLTKVFISMFVTLA